jgi:cytochrome P450
MMEAVLLLATITQQVRLHAEDARPLEFSPSVTLRPKGAVRMRVERVRAASALA